MNTRVFALILLSFFATSQLVAYEAVLFDGTTITYRDQKLILITLAGIVNRDSARLYLVNVGETWSYSKTDEVWRDLYRSHGSVEFDSISSIVALVNRFRPFIKGAITYDNTRWFGNFNGQQFLWQGEYAALIGGLTDRLPVTTTFAAMLQLATADSVLVEDFFDSDSTAWVPGRLESVNHPWNSVSLTEEQKYLSILNWGVNTLLPRCNPTKFFIREINDFTIQQRMFQVNLAGTDELDFSAMPAARAEILERILNDLHSKNPTSIFHIYGWIQPEPMTQWFACFGASFHETMLTNMSWHSSFPVTARSYTPPAKNFNPNTVPVETKYYVTFIGSEGDASNWVIGLQSGSWLSSSRGSVPISWGWNLHLLDLCPFIASYYFDTATPHDGFVSVTTPLGYGYPDLWQDDIWDHAVNETRRLMEKYNIEDIYAYKHYAGSGIMTFRGKTISNSFNFSRLAQFQSAIKAPITIMYDPQLPLQVPLTNFGPLYFNHCDDGSFYGNASDLDAMATRIINNLKKKTKPGFMVAGYQRFRQEDFDNRTSPSIADMTPSRLAQVVQKLKADTSIGADIEVVTIERFSALMRKHLGINQVKKSQRSIEKAELNQNYPNPFNGSTVLRFQIPKEGAVRLRIFDLLGREIAVLLNKRLIAGTHEICWNAGGLPSGIYLCRLETGNAVDTRKFTITR